MSGSPPAEQVVIDGIDAWVEACARAYVPLRIDATGADFRGALRQRSLGTVSVLQVASSPLALTRTARSTVTHPHETVLVCLFLAGSGVTVQDGRIAAFPRGGGFLLDDDQPYSMRYERNEVLTLRLPRDRLALRERDLRELTSTAIPRELGGLNVLGRHLVDLLALDTGLAERETEENQELVLELVHAAVHPVVYSERSRALLSGNAILVSARSFLEQHHTDIGLTIDDVARHFMISRRYLEAIFRRSGDGPAAYLRRVRLHDAADLLATRPQSTVAQIATMVGFDNVNTFTRAFAREFGTTPRGWRRDQPVDWDRPGSRRGAPGRAACLLTELEHPGRPAAASLPAGAG